MWQGRREVGGWVGKAGGQGRGGRWVLQLVICSRGVKAVRCAKHKLWRGHARSCLKASHTAQKQAAAGCAPNVSPPDCDPRAPR